MALQLLLHQLRIPSACRHAFGLLMSGAYIHGTGKAPLQRPRARSTCQHSLAFMAPAHLVPCGVGLEQSTRVRCLKENFSRKVQMPLPSYLATRAFSLAFLSSTTIVALKQCPNRLVCWLPPNIIDHDSLQFTTKTLSSRLI